MLSTRFLGSIVGIDHLGEEGGESSSELSLELLGFDSSLSDLIA